MLCIPVGRATSPPGTVLFGIGSYPYLYANDDAVLIVCFRQHGGRIQMQERVALLPVH
jgi:hypothetical protein